MLRGVAASLLIQTIDEMLPIFWSMVSINNYGEEYKLLLLTAELAPVLFCPSLLAVMN